MEFIFPCKCISSHGMLEKPAITLHMLTGKANEREHQSFASSAGPCAQSRGVLGEWSSLSFRSFHEYVIHLVTVEVFHAVWRATCYFLAYNGLLCPHLETKRLSSC